jgi:membrane protease YdiL (CAAX protease family)
MPNMASLSDHVTFEQNPENNASPPKPSLLAPPGSNIDGPKAIFWNETELRAGWRLAIYLLLFRGFVTTGIAIALRFHLPFGASTDITATGLLVQEGIPMFAAFAAAAILGVLEGRPFGGYGLPATAAFRARFWQGVLWGLAMITAMILLIRLLGGYSFGELALHGSLLWGYAALWALVLLCVGLLEEFIFRGYTLFTLASGVGFWPAATMLSATFGALHRGNGGENNVGALSVFVIGMFFCLTLRRTGNLWFAVGLHAAFDWGETFLFSVPDSGIVAPGHLLSSSFHGPVWLTGSTVGPEGSVMAFVVVGLAAVIFSRLYPSPEENHQLN